MAGKRIISNGLFAPSLLLVLLVPLYSSPHVMMAGAAADTVVCTPDDYSGCQNCTTVNDCDLTDSQFHSARCYHEEEAQPSNSSSSSSSSSSGGDASGNISTNGTCYGIVGTEQFPQCTTNNDSECRDRCGQADDGFFYLCFCDGSNGFCAPGQFLPVVSPSSGDDNQNTTQNATTSTPPLTSRPPPVPTTTSSEDADSTTATPPPSPTPKSNSPTVRHLPLAFGTILFFLHTILLFCPLL